MNHWTYPTIFHRTFETNYYKPWQEVHNSCAGRMCQMVRGVASHRTEFADTLKYLVDFADYCDSVG